MMTLANNAQLTFLRLPHFFRLKYILPQVINPKHHIEFENQYFKIKTANRLDEIRQALRLRYDIFYKEFSNRPAPHQFFPYDIDHFDFSCDHLIIKDKETDRVIACYRLLPPEGQSSHQYFYSDHEFNLESIRNLSGRKLELGRACVHPDYRQGHVISMLWKGIYQYALKAKIKYLFGCSSVTSNELENVSCLIETLKEKEAVLESALPVRNKYLTSNNENIRQYMERIPLCSSQRPRMAPLLGLYVLAGAKVSPIPAYDQEFGCLDFFTLLEIDKISPAFVKRWSA